ncbi:hypothetical protein E1267_18720 [Nonomuraea longispora]|uniref:DUF3806 domain-containing protein n=1 Tax=Nonomuraea longispora TaxID=1848320 RepID=A0A4R4NES9_9ACTN|nr:hypothetical protein [Nonomuraea longispora]TDC05737.1 hypothetical protein E1267_18720 [Nonomuraea longispora]
MEAEELRKIEANVNLAIEQLAPLSDVDFGLNAESVEWVDGFIERQRARPGFDPEQIDGLVGALGSFLGACLVAATGGRWHRPDDEAWGVLLPDGSTAFPFTKVRKQFRAGMEGGESISGFYRVAVGYLATGKMREAREAGAGQDTTSVQRRPGRTE